MVRASAGINTYSSIGDWIESCQRFWQHQLQRIKERAGCEQREARPATYKPKE
ncbi:MAG: hypothetical protein IT435_05175 [Phycisphaerales bacterium]|nr:hypothetical protein [Phycisphaerales bacterium]